jgi:RHS repeat-associated protein
VYDAWGNLLQKNVIKGTAESMALTVNNMNQVTTPAFTYDAAGNVTWDTTHALKYDAEGRMTPTTGTTYTYDGDGRRVQKSDGTLYWVDDSLRPLSVGTTSGSITRDYIFLGSKRIAFVPLSSGNPYYYLSDHLGSAAVIASGDGKTIQWDADYFPFGAVRQVFTSIVGNNYEFTGYENDSETGYNYAVERFDAGRWGRFLSADPYLGGIDITNPQSLNRYAYVLNDPTNMVDPLGLLSECPPGSHAVNPPGKPGHCEDDPVLPADPCSIFGCDGGVGGANSSANNCPPPFLCKPRPPAPGFNIGPQPRPTKPPVSFGSCMTGQLIHNFIGDDDRAGVSVAVHVAALLARQAGGTVLPGPGWVYTATAVIWDGAMITKSYLECRQ